MHLSDLGDPIAGWQYAERYLGVGTRTYSPYSADLDIDPAYHPQLGEASFTVPTFRVPAGAGTMVRNTIASRLLELYRDGDGFLLPVHPNALDCADLVGRDELAGFGPGPDLTVVPSANARTVFVSTMDGAAVPPHFLKLHYPRRLSRFRRRMRSQVIALQLWVADELAGLGLPLLPEVGGAWFASGEPWGFLVRSATLPAGAGPYVVPLFALYGRDYLRPGDPTLLSQLVAASGEDPTRFVARRIVEPMVGMWVRAAAEVGCSLEAHGQNTLVAFSADGTATRVLYRDSAIYVDPARRAALGLDRPMPPMNVIGQDVRMPAEAVFSLGYDSFLGHHALSYLAEAARRDCGVDPAALRAAARDEFERVAAGRRLLPQTVHYYENTLFEDHSWRLVDTGQEPQWRPVAVSLPTG